MFITQHVVQLPNVAQANRNIGLRIHLSVQL